MARLRGKMFAWGLAGLLAAQTGCVLSGATPKGLSGMTLTPEAISPPPSAAKEMPGLPREQAVELSLRVARSMEKNDNVPSAIEQYENVLKHEPNHPEAVRRLAVLYDKAAEFNKAEEMYRKLAKARPKDADVWCDWGYSCYLRNNFGEAEAKLRQALALNPQHARARCNLGLALGQLGRFQEAFQAFRAAGLEEADAHCDLAFVYWAQGKIDEARREYQTADKLSPGCPKAREALAVLDKPPAPRPERDGVAGRDRRPDRRPDRLAERTGPVPERLAGAAPGGSAPIPTPRPSD